MILCVGEILVDMIGAQTESGYVYERKAGGAPFNVACGIKKFGGKAMFAGSVGDDLLGEFLTDFAKSRNFDGLIIDKKSDKNTTLAFVQLDGEGERSFCFYRKNTADCFLPCIKDEELKKASIVHIGSLMLSDDCGLEYALNTADRAHAQNKLVSFDVNYRTDIFRDASVAKERYKKIIEKSDILKFSEDEIEIFGEDYINGLYGKLICVSLGSNGSEWRFGGKCNKVKTIRVTPIDTTGAGDAFYAGVLKQLDGEHSDGWTEDFLNGVFTVANICGALNTLGKGAIDCLPDASAINAVLNKI